MMASRGNFYRIPAPFSDTVIGSVLTRAAGPGCHVVDSTCHTSVRSSNQQRILPSTMALPPLRNVSPLTTSMTRAATLTKAFHLRRDLPSKHQGDNVSKLSAPKFALNSTVQVLVHGPHVQTPGPHDPSDLPAESISAEVATMPIDHIDDATSRHHQRKRKVSIKSEACREQCRTNQARYRQKQREYVSKLEMTVVRLREEIPILEVKRRRLRYDSQQRVWDVVVEYFQLFRHGVSDAFEQGSTHGGDVLRTSAGQQQLMFLRSTMSSDVEFGNVSGVEMLMEHWRQLSGCHEDLYFQLTHMEKMSESIVSATAMLSVTITKTTLERVFPHLMESENVEDLSLAVKLLGHKMDYPCSVLFVWDEESSLVVRVETHIDMASSFLNHLGNLKDVSRAIEGAVMIPNSYINEVR